MWLVIVPLESVTTMAVGAPNAFAIGAAVVPPHVRARDTVKLGIPVYEVWTL